MATACGQWLRDAASAGATVVVPEIADYEVRGEMIAAIASISTSIPA